MQENIKKVIIIGAGPSGLAAGYELSKNGVDVLILEKNEFVGGLARTINYNGYLFDIGPHRFFSKSKEVNKLWQDLLGKDFLEVSRLTRIYYRNKFFSYPVKPFEVLLNLGPMNSIKVMTSYLKAKILWRNLKARTFEEWIISHFGRKLFEMFFKTYTEKVWGIPCFEIGSEWAVQRIKNLSFWSTLKHAIGLGEKNVKSLIEEFHYPRYGAGMMYSKMTEEIKKRGGQLLFGQEVVLIKHKENRIISVITRDNNKKEIEWQADFFFSSMPLTELIKNLSPSPEYKILKAANELYFRSHISVNLIIDHPSLFKDNWIYIHDPNIKMARLTNFRNFSKDMSKDDKTPIGCEYFAFKDDSMWKKTDKELKDLATEELVRLNFIKRENVVDGFVSREEFAYPTYYIGHHRAFNLLKEYITKFKNLQKIGRGGMYRYNNQDHAILTGLLAARNILGANRDIWQVNDEKEYHEDIKENDSIKVNE